jgi:hypothetical protein
MAVKGNPTIGQPQAGSPRRGKQLTTVIIISLIIGVLTFFAVRYFQKRSDPAVRGPLPVYSEQGVTWRELGPDKDGAHYYSRTEDAKAGPGIVRAWTKLVFNDEGRAVYIAKRRSIAMPADGYEQLEQRYVLYELNCFSKVPEYSTQEVFDVTRDGKTLDHAKAGSYKDWQEVPEGSFLDRLCKAVCPPKP